MYATRYFFTWIADRDTRVVGGIPDEYLCEIQQDGYVGSSEEITGQQYPVQIRYQNTGDDKLQSLRGSEATLNLIATEFFQLADLYTENEREFLVVIYRNGDVIWKGFIIPDGCQEQFMFTPYNVSVNAVDGLGLLKNLSFVQNNGNFWLGKITWIDAIFYCLDRLGIDMDINTCVNIYPTGATQGDSYDPFFLTYVNAERYIKDDETNPMNCQEVLSSILQEWTACIIQSEGEWWIYRPTEVALSGTLTFRKYTNGMPVYAGYSFAKNIDYLLGGESEGTILAPLFHINTDQLKMIEKPYKTVSMSYKYGPPVNILENPDFEGINTSGPGDPVGPRTDVNIPGWTKFGTVNAGISGGTALILYEESPIDVANYYENDFPILIPIGYQFKLNLNYESIPALSATDMEFGVELDDGSQIWYLQSTGIWARVTDTGFVSTNFSIRSNFGVSNSIFTSDISPVAGTAVFKLYQPSTPGADIIYQSIEAQVIIVDDPVVGEIHTTQQAGLYSFAPDTINVFNGDGPAQGFYGVIFKQDQDTPTTEWVRRGLSESPLAQPSEADKEFLRIAVEEIQRLYARPYVKFDGSIFGYFNPLSRFTINLISGKFMPLGLEYDLQANICKATLAEVMNTEIALDYELEPDYGETTKVLVK